MPIKKTRTNKKEEAEPKNPPLEEEEEKEDKQTAGIDQTIARYKSKANSPLPAIRSHCVECMGGAVKMVSECTATDCSLWPFRMGINTLDPRYKGNK